MAIHPRISGAWPYLALSTIVTLAWVVSWLAAPKTGVLSSPAFSTSAFPAALFAVAGLLGLRRGRDWRTAITMAAIPPSIGVLSAAAFGQLTLSAIPPWPALTVLLSIVAIGSGLLLGAALRSVRHRTITARS